MAAAIFGRTDPVLCVVRRRIDLRAKTEQYSTVSILGLAYQVLPPSFSMDGMMVHWPSGRNRRSSVPENETHSRVSGKPAIYEAISVPEGRNNQPSTCGPLDLAISVLRGAIVPE